jgi:hypothetical protein
MVARPFLGQIGSTRSHFVHGAMRHRKAAVRAWTEAGDDVGIWQTRKSIPTFRRDVKISRQAHDRSSELTCLPLPRQALRLHRPRGHIIDTRTYLINAFEPVCSCRHNFRIARDPRDMSDLACKLVELLVRICYGSQNP